MEEVREIEGLLWLRDGIFPGLPLIMLSEVMQRPPAESGVKKQSLQMTPRGSRIS